MNNILYEGMHNLFTLLPNYSGFPGRCDGGDGGCGRLGGRGEFADRVLCSNIAIYRYSGNRYSRADVDR